MLVGTYFARQAGQAGPHGGRTIELIDDPIPAVSSGESMAHALAGQKTGLVPSNGIASDEDTPFKSEMPPLIKYMSVCVTVHDRVT